LGKGKVTRATVMAETAAQLDTRAKKAQEDASVAKSLLATLDNCSDPGLTIWLKSEIAKLDTRAGFYDGMWSRASANLARLQEAAKRREVDELGDLETQAMNTIRHYRYTKGCKTENLYDAMDASGLGYVDEKMFAAFLRSCDVPPKKVGNGAAANGAASSAEPLSEEELSRLFAYLDEEGEGRLSKDRVQNMSRYYMRVCKDTVATTVIDITKAKIMRRLDIGEIVEVIEGPVQEETACLQRVFCKVVKDDLEGWVTLAGKDGKATYLEDIVPTFKVVKETILTDAFKLDGGNPARKLRGVNRKLKEGEIVELIEWPRKEDVSELIRMKCRVVSDGAIGWATTLGNGGAVFLAPCITLAF